MFDFQWPSGWDTLKMLPWDSPWNFIQKYRSHDLSKKSSIFDLQCESGIYFSVENYAPKMDKLLIILYNSHDQELSTNFINFMFDHSFDLKFHSKFILAKYK